MNKKDFFDEFENSADDIAVEIFNGLCKESRGTEPKEKLMALCMHQEVYPKLIERIEDAKDIIEKYQLK